MGKIERYRLKEDGRKKGKTDKENVKCEKKERSTVRKIKVWRTCEMDT